MRNVLLLAAALVITAIGAFEPNGDGYKPTNQFSAELIPTNQPIKLLSGATNAQPPAPRLPVYVIPEMLVTVLPDGTRMLFVHQHHIQELANKFRTLRVTNVIIYADGL